MAEREWMVQPGHRERSLRGDSNHQGGGIIIRTEGTFRRDKIYRPGGEAKKSQSPWGRESEVLRWIRDGKFFVTPPIQGRGSMSPTLSLDRSCDCFDSRSDPVSICGPRT